MNRKENAMWKNLFNLVSGALSSAMSGTTIYLIIGAAVLSGAGTGVVVYKIEHAQVLTVKADLRQEKLNFTTCQDTNKDNQSTITQLQKDARAASTTCDKRLALLRAENQRFKGYDSLKGGKVNEKADTSNDPLLHAFYGLFDGPGDR